VALYETRQSGLHQGCVLHGGVYPYCDYCRHPPILHSKQLQLNHMLTLTNPALFYSSVKCTGAPKYPYKDILVHRCTSPMNKTMHPKLLLTNSVSKQVRQLRESSHKQVAKWHHSVIFHNMKNPRYTFYREFNAEYQSWLSFQWHHCDISYKRYKWPWCH